jgi:hypothetical protein
MSTQLALSGVQLTVPAGWDSESFSNSNGMGIFRVGSYRFPHDGMDDTGEAARASMQPNDVLINIIDFTATDPGTTNDAYVPTAPPVTVGDSAAMGQEGYPAPVVAVIRAVRIFERNLHISVAFGTRPSTAQVTAANTVLETLAPA